MGDSACNCERNFRLQKPSLWLVAVGLARFYHYTRFVSQKHRCKTVQFYFCGSWITVIHFFPYCSLLISERRAWRHGNESSSILRWSGQISWQPLASICIPTTWCYGQILQTGDLMACQNTAHVAQYRKNWIVMLYWTLQHFHFLQSSLCHPLY